MKRIVFLVLCAGVFVSLSQARVWTSNKGDTIDAEYVKMFGNKVVLKTNEGKTLKVPVAGLCVDDRKYLASIIPPKIDIGVNVDIDSNTETSGSSYERKSETVKCVVELKKTNPEPCSRKFTAQIYVFARKEKSDMRWLISHAEHSNGFIDENIVQFHSPSALVEYSKSSSGNRGFRYEGYLVVVEDDQGQVVAMESNKEKYETNWSKIKNTRKGSRFDRDFDLLDGKQYTSWSQSFH